MAKMTKLASKSFDFLGFFCFIAFILATESETEFSLKIFNVVARCNKSATLRNQHAVMRL